MNATVVRNVCQETTVQVDKVDRVDRRPNQVDRVVERSANRRSRSSRSSVEPSRSYSFIHSGIYIAPLQGNYDQALPTPTRPKKNSFEYKTSTRSTAGIGLLSDGRLCTSGYIPLSARLTQHRHSYLQIGRSKRRE